MSLKIPNYTVADKVTHCIRFNWRKHGPSLYGGNCESAYVENELKRMSRTDFLNAISAAIEERLIDERAK